jgi:multiple sugar transport system substrate-binding protein
MKRRTLLRHYGRLAGSAGFVPAALAAACAPGATAPPPGPGPAGGAKGEVTFLDWEASLEGLPTETVLKNFQAKSTGVTLTFDTLGTNYEEKMRTLLAAGTPYDVHRVNDDYVRGNGTKGLMTDLMPLLKRDKIRREDYFEFLYDFPAHEGKYWAWSTGNQPRLLYVNTTLFQNKGLAPPRFDRWDPPGWTWEDMVAAATRLTDLSNPEQPTFGVNLYEDTGFEQTFLVNFGVEEGIYARDGRRWLMATPAGAEAMQTVIDLSCRLRIQRPFNHREGGAAVGGSALFRQGRLAMHFGTMTAMRDFRRDIKDFDWDVAPVPKKARRMTEGSLISYCIPKEAKNVEGAWLVLQHMTAEESGKVFAEAQYYVPAAKAPARALQARPGEKPERIRLFVESMSQYNTIVNFTSNTERARLIYRPELGAKAFVCTEPAQQTLDGVKKQVEDALAGQA